MTELVRIFFHAGWRRPLAVLTCLLLATLAESVGLATVLPIFSTATQGSDRPRSALDQAVFDTLDALGLPADFGLLLVIVVIGFTLKQLLSFWAGRFVGSVVADLATGFRLELVDRLLEARWGYFADAPRGRFLNAIGTEAQGAASAFESASKAIAAAVSAAAYLVLALLVSWKLFLVALAIGGVSGFLLMRLVKRARRYGKQQVRLNKEMIGDLTDVLTGLKPLKAMGKHLNLAKLLRRQSKALHRTLRRQVINRALVTQLREPIEAAFLAVAFYLAISHFGLDAPQLLLMAVLLGKSVRAMGRVQQATHSALGASPFFWSLVNESRRAREARETWTGRGEPSFAREIRLQGVSFSYGERAILRHVDVTIEVGKLTTVLGPSGAGKSTLVDLIVGLQAPHDGTVLLDGQPLEGIDIRLWRRRIGYVPQEVILLNDTVRENIVLGDETLGDDDVRRAIADAGALDFIEALPEGLDTMVGERGTRLSGGQRQRLAIARALVHQPALLILDEATSALDPEIESAICRSVRALTGEVTVLAITHQPAWAEIADRVFQVDRGKVRAA